MQCFPSWMEYLHKNSAFKRECRHTHLVSATNILTICLSILVLLTTISIIVPNLNLFTKLAYAVEEFDVDIDVEDNNIERGDTQHITITVSNDDTNSKVSDANVRLTVDPPDSESSSATDETSNNGEARFDVRIDDNAEIGEYDIDVRVSKNGYDTKAVSTSFDVIRGDGDNRDSDRNGNGSSVTVLAAAAAAASSGGSASGASGAAVGTGSGSAGGTSNRGPSGAAGASVSPER
jgi:hypothetical protein